MMVINTADELAVCIAEASILIVRCIILRNAILANPRRSSLETKFLQRSFSFIIQVLAIIIAEVQTTSTSRERYLVAELDFSAGERRIEDAVIIDLRELTEFDLEVVVVALSPDTLEINFVSSVPAGESLSISVEASRRALTCQLLLTSALGSRRNSR